MKREKFFKKKAAEKTFIKARADGNNKIQSAKIAFPEVMGHKELARRATALSKREDIQLGIVEEIEKTIQPKWAVEILKDKIQDEGKDSIKALGLYFDIVGAKKTEHLVKSESKNVNFNINIDGAKIQEAVRKARAEIDV